MKMFEIFVFFWIVPGSKYIKILGKVRGKYSFEYHINVNKSVKLSKTFAKKHETCCV